MGTIDVLPSIAQVGVDEWDSLVAAAGAAVTYHHRLLRGYELAGLGGQHSVAYLAGRDAEGVLAAALPLYLTVGRSFRSWRYRCPPPQHPARW